MRSFAVLLAGLALLLASVAGVAGQDSIVVRENQGRSEFPDGIVFTIDATADTAIDDVRLVYQVAPDGVRTSAVPDCTGTTVVSCTFELTASRRNVIIPGAEVEYFWELRAGDERHETAVQVLMYEDSRFDWMQVTEGNVTIWWYRGSEDDARAVLEAGREALAEVGALIGTTIEFPVKIRYYGSASDMQAAIIADNDEGVVTLGEVVYSDTAMVSADSSPLDITRHEITHIVVREAVGRRGVPDWLNEGLAVFAQSGPLAGQSRAVEAAIESGDILSVRSLSSSSSGATSDRVSLFYGQSWALVTFLIETYGEEQFAELFRAFGEGANDDEALEQVYGFDQDGFENAWRASVGLEPRATPEPPSDPEARVEETQVAQDVERAGGDDGGTSVGVIVTIAVLTVLLLAGLAGLGVVVARRFG